MEKWRFCRKVSSSCTDLFFLLLCLPMFLFYFSSCDNEEGYLKGHGTVYLQLQADTTFAASGKTKATDGFDEFKNVSNYSVEISQGEKVVTSYEKYSDMPTSIDLESGTYQLKAFLGELLPAKFEAPYFAGTTKFQVEANKKTSASVTCALANTKVSVSYSEDFKEAYPDYSLSMTTAHTSEALVFKKGETRSAYFQADSTGQKLNMSMSLTSLENKKTTFTPSAITIKPREDVKLLFKTDGEAVSGVKLEITIDGSTADTTVNVGIPDYMLPLEAPLVTPVGFVSEYMYAIAPGDETYGKGGAWAVDNPHGIDIFAPGTIDSCIMEVNSPYLRSLGMKERYDLANLSEEDSTALESRNGFGLKWNPMYHQRSVKDAVDITTLVYGRLMDAEKGSSHEFIFYVKDSLKQHQISNKVVLRVTREDAEFEIDKNLGNIWATKAYLKANVYSGNIGSVYFQIKQGSSWKDIDKTSFGHVYSVEGQNRILEVTGLTPGTRYTVRARYGGNTKNYSEEFEFVTETEAQLPNADLEEWYKETVYKQQDLFGSVLTPAIEGWYPVQKDSPATSWWLSSNMQTIFAGLPDGFKEKDVKASNIHNGGKITQTYILYPGVEMTEEAYNGSKAAKITSVGWGETIIDGQVITGTKQVSPGKLYLATGDGQQSGAGFSSRPTAMSFAYKYLPQNGESFKMRAIVKSNEDEIGYTELVSGLQVSSYKKVSVPFVYHSTDKKATHIYIEFISSTSGSRSFVKADVHENTVAMGDWVLGKYVYYKFTGSTLYVDDINLEY